MLPLFGSEHLEETFTFYVRGWEMPPDRMGEKSVHLPTVLHPLGVREHIRMIRQASLTGGVPDSLASKECRNREGIKQHFKTNSVSEPPSNPFQDSRQQEPSSNKLLGGGGW